MKSWDITRKDLKLLMRDARTVVVLVALPLVFIFIIGTTFGKLLGWEAQNQVLKVGFLDNIDYGSLTDDPGDVARPLSAAQKTRNARQILVNLMNSLQAREGIRVDLMDRAEADRLMERADLEAVVVVGPKFYEKIDELRIEDVLDQGKGRLKDGLSGFDITIEKRKGNEGTGSVVEQMIYGDTIRNVANYVACRKENVLRVRIRERCEEWEAPAVEGAAQAMPDPPQPLDQEGKGQASTIYNRVVPGLTVMFVFFLVNIMARSFIQEREIGTLRRLRIAPLSPTALLLGKTIPFLLVSLAQSALLFGCGKLLFDMSFGPKPWLIFPVTICTSLAATSLGLLVATFVKTDAQVSAYANIIVISMAGISGCLIPRSMLPWQMLQLSLITPHAWAVEAYKEILPEGQLAPNMQAIWTCCAVLLAFSVTCFTIGVLRFRKAG